MANPQKENGFTSIANEILEQTYKQKMNGTQAKIILFLWRYTYGYNRKIHAFSEKFISDNIDCNIRQVRRELKQLIDSKIIIVTKEATRITPRELKFNKNYDQWKIDIKKENKLIITKDKKTEELKKCFDYYSKNIGLISPIIAGEIESFVDDGIEIELINKSIEIATINNKRSWAYCKGILNSSLKRNIKTLIDFNFIQKGGANKENIEIKEVEFLNNLFGGAANGN